jgi:hypothetical protein
VKLLRQKWYQTVTVDGVEKPPVEIIKFYNHCHTVMNAQIKGETVVGQGIQKFKDFSEHVNGDVSNLIKTSLGTGNRVTQEDVDGWKSECDMEVVERIYDGDALNQIERYEEELENQRNEELDQDAGL